jgi:hypothetical protein
MAVPGDERFLAGHRPDDLPSQARKRHVESVEICRAIVNDQNIGKDIVHALRFKLDLERPDRMQVTRSSGAPTSSDTRQCMGVASENVHLLAIEDRSNGGGKGLCESAKLCGARL